MKRRILALVLLVALIGMALTATAQEPELVEYSDDMASFSYPAEGFASEVTMTEVEAIPYDENAQMPIWAANPAFTQYAFVDYAGLEADAFFLTPYIMILPTADFETYTDRGEFAYGYGVELEALQALLAEEPDLSTFVNFDTNREGQLPHVPVFNAAQVFRAQPAYLEFAGGKGLRYLTYYSQAVNPITDKDIFYTFQGITDDGMYYIAAVFPVQTGVLPADISMDLDYEQFSANYETYLEETVAALDGQDPEAFNPTLPTLDALIESLVLAN